MDNEKILIHENDKVVLPDYIMEDMQKNNKVYGTSVLDMIPVQDEVSSESDVFDEQVYEENEISDMKKEIKESYSGETVKEIISVDALSGIKTSTGEIKSDNEKMFDDIDKTLESGNIRGKSLTRSGKALISSLINEEPTDEEELQIATKFEQYRDSSDNIDFSKISIQDLESFVSDRIKRQIKSITEDSGDYENIFRRFLQQLFTPYKEITGYRDDMSELTELCRNIDKSGLLNDKSNEESLEDIREKFSNFQGEEDDINNSFETLKDMSEKIEKSMELLKKLDDRNKRLKQDFTIDDVDIKLYSEIKECLDDALEFKRVKNKVVSAAGLYKKEIRNKSDVDKSIDSWIHSIKHDPYTIYTFPCNDYLSDSESREKIIEFFANAYLIDYITKNNIIIPEDEDLTEYLLNLDNRYSDIISEFIYKAWIMLYILSRTFKYGKIQKDDAYVRTLSYTLDLISKLGVKDHRDRFVEASDFVYNTIIN